MIFKINIYQKHTKTSQYSMLLFLVGNYFLEDLTKAFTKNCFNNSSSEGRLYFDFCMSVVVLSIVAQTSCSFSSNITCEPYL